MAMDFPSNPIDGQIYGNYVYSVSAGAWKGKPQLQQTTIHSSTVPATANVGDIWFNTSDGTSFTYNDDGTSKQWVEIVGSAIRSVDYAAIIILGGL